MTNDGAARLATSWIGVGWRGFGVAWRAIQRNGVEGLGVVCLVKEMAEDGAARLATS